jgi:NAD(P)-dependent dehydrogenase (short-subunit alcohol dehydrogenase family)
MSAPRTLLLAGSSGSIGKAIYNKYASQGWRIITLSRTTDVDLSVSLSEPDSVDILKDYFIDKPCPDLVINCAGILHENGYMPEKQLSEIKSLWLQKSVEVNVISHIHLAQGIEDSISKAKPIVWISLSAMVGSINDNGLGGWYSYRISKAALNMFIKGLSIEWSRKNKLNKVFAVHPGTTKSTMSDPFNVRKDKLYSPELSAQRIYEVIDNSEEYKSGSFLNWDASLIPW